jgi:hypothetical protein
LGVYGKVTLKPGVNPLVPYNEKRKALIIINESEYTIWVGESQIDLKDKGLPLYPFEVIIFDRGEGDSAQYAFFAYSDVETTIKVYEGVE